jgi:hypothetical protein
MARHWRPGGAGRDQRLPQETQTVEPADGDRRVDGDAFVDGRRITLPVGTGSADVGLYHRTRGSNDVDVLEWRSR